MIVPMASAAPGPSAAGGLPVTPIPASFLPYLPPFRSSFSLPLPLSPPSPRVPVLRRRPPHSQRGSGVLSRCFRCHAAAEASSGGGRPEEELSRGTLLWRAAKLPIYSVALVPLTVGSATAYLETGIFFTRRYVVLLVASVFIITWLNLSNDVYDFDTGADQNKKESVVNIIGSRAATHTAAFVSLILGFAGLVFASTESGDVRTILLLIVAVLCGYVYQCPPFRLSYKGLGEPLCFAAFGPFATTAFYLSQGGRHISREQGWLPLTGTILSASVMVGLTTTLILFCSHFHQIDGDLAVGKMSPLVRLGTKKASEVVKVTIITLYLLLCFLGLTKVVPSTCAFLCALTLPVGKLVVDYVNENHNNMAKIFMAKYYCVRLHSLFGVLLAAGLVLARNGTSLQLLRPFIS